MELLSHIELIVGMVLFVVLFVWIGIADSELRREDGHDLDDWLEAESRLERAKGYPPRNGF